MEKSSRDLNFEHIPNGSAKSVIDETEVKVAPLFNKR
jgi:hypothetical protein